MNRLWVRISLVLVLVIMIVAAFPIAYRFITREADRPLRTVDGPPVDDRDWEDRQAHMEQTF